MPNQTKHNTPSNADWCNHGKGWTVDCTGCGRTDLHALLLPGLSNNAVRVRLEMLEHAVFTKSSPGSPLVPVPLGNSLAPEATPENSSSASWLGAPCGEPGGIVGLEWFPRASTWVDVGLDEPHQVVEVRYDNGVVKLANGEWVAFKRCVPVDPPKKKGELPIITRKRLEQLAEMLARDRQEFPQGQSNPEIYVNREELAELVRGYLELVVLAEEIASRVGGVRT